MPVKNMSAETSTKQIHPVILSGGAGTRLWPLSRELFPKQLHALGPKGSLLQATAGRIAGAPLVVCNHEHRFIVAEQLREVGIEPRALLIEPFGRNTAPAAAVAALKLAEHDPAALMLVMPSDHVIRDDASFLAAIEKAAPLAAQGDLVTFGITPTGPHTGYGYIERGDPLGEGFRVRRFVEKPAQAVAEAFVAAGTHDWNAGIFLFRADAWLAELDRHRPGIVAACRDALAEGAADLFFQRLGETAFARAESISIDHAVMERTGRAAVVPVAMGWSDIGSWSAVWQEGPQDADGNVALGEVVAMGTTGSYLRSDKALLAVIGMQDVAVVATGDAVLVAPRSRDQEVRLMVEELKRRQRPEATIPLRTYRPWGWFQVVDEGPRFKVKHIQVNPGHKLSLQKHWHRSEHWVVVTGTAQVTCGEKHLLLRENESTFIPAGVPHRLENPGKVPLRMVEVQSGEYVGEDDIVRLDDVYGR
jgi:mannose-1-phosphate guanylyltransferase/mannose-6-phosphate isomerase